MKKTILTISIILISIAAVSGISNIKGECSIVTHPFTYVTPDMDTLYLSSEELISELIYKSWKDDPEWDGTNPHIIFVKQKEINRLHSENDK